MIPVCLCGHFLFILINSSFHHSENQLFFRYVTSAIASSEVVYCSQLDPKKSEKNSGEKSKSELYQAQSSPSSNRTAPPLTSETRQPSNFVKTEQTNLDQRSGTKKLLNCDDDVTVNGNARDDMLANVIEASDDDDNDEVTKTSPILNGHTPNLTTRGGAFPVSNGFHSSLSEVIKKTLMQVTRNFVRVIVSYYDVVVI